MATALCALLHYLEIAFLEKIIQIEQKKQMKLKKHKKLALYLLLES